MLAKAYSATPRGVGALIVTVEVDRIRAQLPSVTVVGLPDTAVREARERVFAAIRHLGRRGERYGLILMDPPYASVEGETAMIAVLEARILSHEGELVVESSRHHRPGEVVGLERLDERRYGDTVMQRFRNCNGCGGGE